MKIQNCKKFILTILHTPILHQTKSIYTFDVNKNYGISLLQYFGL